MSSQVREVCSQSPNQVNWLIIKLYTMCICLVKLYNWLDTCHLWLVTCCFWFVVVHTRQYYSRAVLYYWTTIWMTLWSLLHVALVVVRSPLAVPEELRFLRQQMNFPLNIKETVSPAKCRKRRSVWRIPDSFLNMFFLLFMCSLNCVKKKYVYCGFASAVSFWTSSLALKQKLVIVSKLTSQMYQFE